jgi:signal peptidase I
MRYAIAATLLVLILIVVHASFSIYEVASASMEPTLHCAAFPGCRQLRADRIVVDRFAYIIRPIARGDIVAFKLPVGPRAACRGPGVAVKRVVGLPGETIRQTSGTIYLNNEPLPGRRAPERDFVSMTIPGNRYFLVGDNQLHSCDSRRFGTVLRSRVLGKVVLVASGWRLHRP